MNMIPDNLLRALCWALLHSLWQGLIFAVVAGTIMVLTKKSSSALRYNLLCCGMILFLAVSGYTFYTQLHTVDAGALSPAISQVTDGGRITPATGVETPTAGANPVIAAAKHSTHAFRNAVDSLVQYFNTHAALVVVIWFILFLARFVRLLSGLVYAQRIRHYQTSAAPAQWQQRVNQLLHQLRISRPVVLLESALINVPVVVGVLKPAVLVPIGMLANLPADQVESILLHELGHIRRKDYLFNLAQHVVDTLFFFNPALIWVSSLIRTERENCCDDIAIRETRSRRQLIEALVSFHEYRQREGQFALGFAGNKENQVVKRVKRIVHKTNHSINAGERVMLMGGLLILSAAFITINGSRIATPGKKLASVSAVVPAVNPVIAKPVPTAPATPAEKTAIRTKTVTQPKTVIQPTTDTTKPASTETAANETVTYLGYRNLPLDKIIEMKEHGVTAEYILSFRKMGYPDISPDQAIELRDHGVTVEYIREFQSMGFKNISLRMAQKLRDNGVSVEFIHSLTDMGYQPFSLDQATELREHGVTAGFIARINELGFSHIPLEKAKELVDHGVTGDYIAACKKKFGKLFELNDYIKLRDAGINPAE